MSQHRYELCSSTARVRRRGPARWLAMAEIAELIAADYLHIMRWQMRLAELRPRRGDPAVLPALAAIWDTLASLIDLHMATDDEVCGPAIYGTGPHGLNLAREAADAHEDIREIIRETGLYPPGSPLWWTLATATLAAWTRCLHREVHGPLADRRRQASPALRARLARQWRTFMDARIRDRYQDPPPEVPTCQLRQTRAVATVPRLADPAFARLACVCPACTRELDPFPGVGSPGPARLEPIEVGLNLLRQPGLAGALTSAIRLTPRVPIGSVV